MLSLRRQDGMSLIEVMVGLTLAAILLALAAPSFSTGMQNRQIRTAAEAIQNGLTYARTEALRRNRNVQFELQDPNGWRVGCEVEDTTLIDGEEACPATMQTREALEGSMNAVVESVETVTSATGAASGTATFEGDVGFTPLGRTTGATLPAGQVASYRISNPTGGDCVAAGGPMRCLWVVVTSAGQVRMCDPAVAAGDSRAC